ncbi:hypothetical protein [Rhodopirellula bahusiensis]|nr:hypothetical protein [Rhodopirellula bahusiensis]
MQLKKAALGTKVEAGSHIAKTPSVAPNPAMPCRATSRRPNHQ